MIKPIRITIPGQPLDERFLLIFAVFEDDRDQYMIQTDDEFYTVKSHLHASRFGGRDKVNGIKLPLSVGNETPVEYATAIAALMARLHQLDLSLIDRRNRKQAYENLSDAEKIERLEFTLRAGGFTLNDCAEQWQPPVNHHAAAFHQLHAVIGQELEEIKKNFGNYQFYQARAFERVAKTCDDLFTWVRSADFLRKKP